MTSGMPFDSNIWYRLTSYSADAGGVLAGNPADLDDNGLPSGYVDLNMEGFSSYDNQYWQLSSQPSGYYRICNCWLGPDYGLGFSLDNTSTYRPILYDASPGAGPDQLWNITTVYEGVFSLANPFVGVDAQKTLYLDVTGGVPGLDNNTVGYNWLWAISEVGQINNDTYSSVSPGTTTSSPTLSSTAAADITATLAVSTELATVAAQLPTSSSSDGLQPSVTDSSISIKPTFATPSTTEPPTSSTTVDPGTFSPATPASDAGKTSTATVAGIGAGVSIAVVLFGVFVVCMIIRRRRRQQQQQRRKPLEQCDNDDGTTAVEQPHGEGRHELSAAEEKKHFGQDAELHRDNLMGELHSDQLLGELQDSGRGELPAVAKCSSNIMSELE